MYPIYRAWWRLLMDLRPTVRFLAERFPRFAPWAIRTRWLTHLIVGNPVQFGVLAEVVVLWLLGYWHPVLWLLVVFVFAMMEARHRLFFKRGPVLVGWREAWRLRRQFPGVWAQVAAKTHRVQAEVGTSKEPVASAVLRPVADHPKMSWWPRIEWPVVSWWVGPPPGRSLAALDELTTILAANMPRVADVVVDYEREHDSHGRLIVSFEDVLADPSTPTWQTTNPGPSDGDVLVGGLADVIELFDLTEQREAGR